MEGDCSQAGRFAVKRVKREYRWPGNPSEGLVETMVLDIEEEEVFDDVVLDGNDRVDQSYQA